ncbi:MAG: class I SAM-dependent methyltransferase [Phycisphaerae bacterium]
MSAAPAVTDRRGAELWRLLAEPLRMQAGAAIAGFVEHRPHDALSLPLPGPQGRAAWSGDVPIPPWPAGAGVELLDEFVAAGLLEPVAGRFRATPRGQGVLPAFPLYHLCAGEGLAQRFPRLKQAVAGRAALDAGCGYGAYSWMLAELGAARVLSLDYSDDRLGVAVEAVGGRWPSATFLRGSVEGYPLPDASVDFVFCRVVLPQVHHGLTIRELARVLSPGGAALFMLHAPRFYWNLLRRAAWRGEGLHERVRCVLALLRGAWFDLTLQEIPLRIRGRSFRIMYERRGSFSRLLAKHGLALSAWEDGAVKPYAWIDKPAG